MNTTAEDHARCDEFVAACTANSTVKPCCTKGCHACCYESVYASESEVNFILSGMSDEAKSALAVRVQEWLEKVKAILPECMPKFWDYLPLRARCPLLGDDGLCSVYASRPLGCRVWFACGNPADCEMPARKGQGYAHFPDQLFKHIGVPARVNGHLIHDHLGVLLAERLLGIKLVSGSRRDVPPFLVTQMFKRMGEFKQAEKPK